MADIDVNKTVFSIQYLRGIAAMMVVVFHLITRIPTLSYGPLSELNLGGGVDIFFVISGFIMTVTSRRSAPLQFARRRIARIVPLYWILTIVLAITLLVAPQTFRMTSFKVEYLVKSLLFIPFQSPGHEGTLLPPLLNPGWSLNMEMFFYLIFAFVLLAPERLRVSIVGVVFVAVMLCALMPLPPELRFYTNARVVSFWLGMVIAQLYLNEKLIPKYPAVLLLTAGFALLLTADPNGGTVNRILFTALPSAAIVLGAASLEHHLPRLSYLNSLGDASYSLYLTHIFTLGAAGTAWVRFGRGGAIGFALFALPISIIGGLLAYRFIEKPFTVLSHRRERLSRKPVEN